VHNFHGLLGAQNGSCFGFAIPVADPFPRYAVDARPVRSRTFPRSELLPLVVRASLLPDLYCWSYHPSSLSLASRSAGTSDLNMVFESPFFSQRRRCPAPLVACWPYVSFHHMCPVLSDEFRMFTGGNFEYGRCWGEACLGMDCTCDFRTLKRRACRWNLILLC